MYIKYHPVRVLVKQTGSMAMGGDSTSTPEERASGAIAKEEHKAQQEKQDEQEWEDIDSDDEDTVRTYVPEHMSTWDIGILRMLIFTSMRERATSYE